MYVCVCVEGSEYLEIRLSIRVLHQADEVGELCALVWPRSLCFFFCFCFYSKNGGRTRSRSVQPVFALGFGASVSDMVVLVRWRALFGWCEM